MAGSDQPRRVAVDADALEQLLAAAIDTDDPPVRRAVARLVATGAAPTGRTWLPVDQAAALLGVSDRTVRRAVARGDLEHLRVGRRLLIRRPG
jgi:excisionase family DNA binding protein